MLPNPAERGVVLHCSLLGSFKKLQLPLHSCSTATHSSEPREFCWASLLAPVKAALLLLLQLPPQRWLQAAAAAATPLAARECLVKPC
jgi:hypothetical protein